MTSLVFIERLLLGIVMVLFAGGVAECDDALEFFARQTEIHGHLFELVTAFVIGRRGAKTLNARREAEATHFLRDGVSSGTFVFLLLQEAKVAELHWSSTERSAFDRESVPVCGDNSAISSRSDCVARRFWARCEDFSSAKFLLAGLGGSFVLGRVFSMLFTPLLFNLLRA
jgi:hypothetical protein